MKLQLEEHKKQLQDEKTQLEQQQASETRAVEDQVNQYRRQLLSGITARYSGLLEKKQIEIETIERLINNLPK